MLVLSGTVLSSAALTLALRHSALIHPEGRSLMPWLPLIGLPLLARFNEEILDRALPLVIRIFVLLQLFTSFALVGGRYALGV